jgi:hypothetical protein
MGSTGSQKEKNRMRFVMMVMLSDESARKYEEGYVGEPGLYAEMDKFNQEMLKAGVMLSGEGLRNTSGGAKITFTGGKTQVFDGPFAETKELFGGYWIIQTKDRDEAIAWARKAPMEETDTLVLRQIMEMDEFEEEIQKAAGHTPQ